MNATWMLAALTTGLVGSLHCVGMCGPLAMALPVGRLPSAQRSAGVGLYHLGRIAAYAGLGVAVGSVGQGLLLLGLQRPVAIGAGLWLIAWTLFYRGRAGSLVGNQAATWLRGPMQHIWQHPRLRTFALLGLLNGLLPCGFVYVALAGAIVTGHALASAVYMALFGVGTVPALLLIRWVPNVVSVGVRGRLTRLLPVFTVSLGLLLLVRGLYQPPHPRAEASAIPLCHEAGLNTGH